MQTQMKETDGTVLTTSLFPLTPDAVRRLRASSDICDHPTHLAVPASEKTTHGLSGTVATAM